MKIHHYYFDYMHIGGEDKPLKWAISAHFRPPWPWIGSYGIQSCITHRPLPTYQISFKLE